MAVRRAPIVAERELFAEYPFLPGAEGLVREVAPSVRDLLGSPTFARARELGRARIRAAADDPTGTRGVQELAHAALEERFLSFLYARMLLSAAPTLAPIRRWAVAEAKQAMGRLGSAPDEELVAVAGRLGFPLDDLGGGSMSFRVPDYLRLAAPIREADFRLVHQGVAGGRVHVGRARAARLLQEGIRGRLTAPLSLAEDAREAFASTEAAFLREVAERIPLPVARSSPGGAEGLKPERFPPCIRKMRRMLNDGENLSHAGRFALAAFLHRAGADFETIVDAFRGAPDFDEGITRYQVEHITQHDGGLGYEPPECATLRSHGLCFREGDPAAPSPADRLADPLCHEPWLKHPLQYYRTRGGSVRERPAAEPTGATPPTAGAGPGRSAAPARRPSTARR